MSAQIGRPPSGWARYDDVAEPYERAQATNAYADLAADLVRALNLTRGNWLLDVGCGTGAAMLTAQRLVGPHGFVVGLDPSLPMLRRAALAGAAPLVAGIVPGLPFAADSFDGVAASLVLSHVPNHEAALRSATTKETTISTATCRTTIRTAPSAAVSGTTTTRPSART